MEITSFEKYAKIRFFADPYFLAWGKNRSYMGESGPVKTRILAYFMQCIPKAFWKNIPPHSYYTCKLPAKKQTYAAVILMSVPEQSIYLDPNNHIVAELNTYL